MTDNSIKMRECVCCAAKARSRAPFDSDQPSIAALNVTIYRRGSKARDRKGRRQQLQTTLQVRVCESCLGRVLAARHGKLLDDPDAALLAAALFDRIAERYSTMREDRAA